MQKRAISQKMTDSSYVDSVRKKAHERAVGASSLLQHLLQKSSYASRRPHGHSDSAEIIFSTTLLLAGSAIKTQKKARQKLGYRVFAGLVCLKASCSVLRYGLLRNLREADDFLAPLAFHKEIRLALAGCQFHLRLVVYRAVRCINQTRPAARTTNRNGHITLLLSHQKGISSSGSSNLTFSSSSISPFMNASITARTSFLTWGCFDCSTTRSCSSIVSVPKIFNVSELQT